jgi:hypothetical protein
VRSAFKELVELSVFDCADELARIMPAFYPCGRRL